MWDVFQWHTVHTKFCENCSVAPKSESVDIGLTFSSAQEGQQITTRTLLRTGTLEVALML